MKIRLLAAMLLLSACAATPGPAPSIQTAARDPALQAIAGQVSEQSLHGYIEKMVSFGTRSTLSDQTSPTRGIGAARKWVASEFQKISADCGGCLTIVNPSDTVTGQRYRGPTHVENVVAIQRGTTDPDRVIIIQGHLDSRNSDNFDVTNDAPGANDDASGVAASIEAARVLSKQKFGATLVYAALSGEEQGLNGSRIFPAYAKAQGWKIVAVLNNDIVGNSQGVSGVIDDKTVRVFSEGVRATETPQMASARRSNGGELDSPSRNLSRYIAGIAESQMDNFRVRMIYRMDRFGRGGDHASFQEQGYPAVRVTEGAENYTRQHQTLRTENGIRYGDTIDGVDFAYLARVTRLNAMTMASLAMAPAPPTAVAIRGAVSADTEVSWTAAPGAVAHIVWWRDTTSPVWQHSQRVEGSAAKTTLKGVVIDDWFVGVSSVSASGHQSPVVFAGAVGAWAPPAPVTPRAQ